MNCSEYELYELCACITHIIRMRVYFDYLNPKKTRPTLLKSLFLALRAPKSYPRSVSNLLISLLSRFRFRFRFSINSRSIRRFRSSLASHHILSSLTSQSFTHTTLSPSPLHFWSPTLIRFSHHTLTRFSLPLFYSISDRWLTRL